MPQSRQRLTVFGTAGRFLAGDDVIDMTDRKALHLDMPPPCIFKPLDAIRRENQIEIEWAVLKLNEILSAPISAACGSDR